MNIKIKNYIEKYKNNPGWYWLLACVFLFFVLPEYISPFVLFIAFIIFKRQWTKEGRKAKVGTLGKMEMIFMGYMLVSVLWSPTKLDTLGCAGLWWAVFLCQVMIFNMAKTRQRIDKIISVVVASAAFNGLIGGIQIVGYTLYKFSYLPYKNILKTPFYRYVDKAVYGWLPFDISTDMWVSRASGFFSNPNLLATFMVMAYPLSVYLFLNAKTKKQRIIYFIENVLISIGMSSTMTRAGCIIALLGWLFMFVVLFKRHWKNMLKIFIPTVAVIVPSLLTRYGLIFQKESVLMPGTITEAQRSSEAHVQIWQSALDYIVHHINVLIYGTGFGMGETGNVLRTYYNLDKPHSHNFIIEITMELGIIGLIALFAIIICAFGKLFEIDSNNSVKFTLVLSVMTSILLYFLFGLTDYIFNSPKQILMFMILLGLTQSISYCYEKNVIDNVHDIEYVAKKDLKNIIYQ